LESDLLLVTTKADHLRHPGVTQKLLASAIFLLAALLVYFVLAQRFPISGDDYSYIYQAKLFASGKLYAADPIYDTALPFYDCVETLCLEDDQGHRFSKYPPGWPALLAVGVKLRAPWLVDPLLGALLIFLMLDYVSQRMGKKLVRATSLLLLLCFFLCYYAGSFRPHIATALFVFAAFFLYDAAERRVQPSKLWLFSAGLLLGYTAMIRYTDWVPLTAWIGVGLLRRKRFADLVLFGIGFGVLASGNLLYNALLLGDPFQLPGALNRSPDSLDYRLVLSWNGFVVTVVRLGTLLLVFPPTLLLVFLWRRYQASSKIKMYVALFSMNVATYFFYPAGVGGPGPRYFLAYFPFLVLAVVDLYQEMSHDSRPTARYLWNFAIVSLVVCSLVFAANEAYTMYWRRDLERTARHLRGGKKIFLLKTGTYRTAAGDLTRNPPMLSSADSLYFRWCDEQPKRDALLKRFPGRDIFVYEYPGCLYPYNLNRGARTQP
jgi:hypothetical protein